MNLQHKRKGSPETTPNKRHVRHKRLKLPVKDILTPEDWALVRENIMSQSVRDGDHLIWRGEHKVQYERDLPTLQFFGILREAQHWWQLAVRNGKADDDDNDDGTWQSYCEVEKCLEHYCSLLQ